MAYSTIEKARLLKAEREQRELAEALRDVTTALNSTLDLNELLKLILAYVGRVVPHDTASIMLVESDQVHIVGNRGHDKHWQPQVVGLRFSLADLPNLRHMAETGQPLTISDTRTAPDWVDIPETRWIRSYAGAPICLKKEVVGFLNLSSARPGFFTQVHAKRLQAFCRSSWDCHWQCSPS